MTGLHAFAQTPPQPLTATTAVAAAGTATAAFDGVVEAVRQTVVAAQVPGAVVQLDVKVGDRVKAGQLLLRLDARAAEQNATASDAQVQAARAALELAAKDFERQQRLFQKNYISQAAMERAESAYKSAQAQANALLAQASASRTQSGYHLVRAPFAGVVSEVPVSLGDMAMPGRALLTLYDPTALRVTAAVPQSLAGRLPGDAKVRIELPGLPASGASVAPARVQLLPTVDAATHTVQIRADLPRGVEGIAPGMFARLWLPVARGDTQAGSQVGLQVGTHAGTQAHARGSAAGPPTPLSVPASAVVRRAEMTGLYVLDPQGKPVLRQVRLGRAAEGRVEVLSGLMAGEQVVTDPQAAARMR
ncbi:MAG: efflux RND transporter periplasmic adaptor subunit [Burkholderiaceae bacterium]